MTIDDPATRDGLGQLEAMVHDGEGRLCASATSTLLAFDHPR